MKLSDSPRISSLSQTALRLTTLGLMGFSAVLAPYANAQTEPLKLRLRLRSGDQFLYQIALNGTMTVDGSPGFPVPPMKLTGLLRNERTVLGAHGDGTYVIKDQMLGGQMTAIFTGKPQQMPVQPSAPQISTVNALGKMVLDESVKDQFRTASAHIGFDPTAMVEKFTALMTFPMEPVTVGSQWQRSAGVQLPLKSSLNIVMDSKLAKMVSVSEVPTAEVVSTVKIPAKFFFKDAKTSSQIIGVLRGDFRTNYSTSTGMPIRTGGGLDGTVSMKVKGANPLVGNKYLSKVMGLQSAQIHFHLTVQVKMLGAKRRGDVEVASASQALSRLKPTVASRPALPRKPAALPASRGPVPPMPVGNGEGTGTDSTNVAAVSPVELLLPTTKGFVNGEVPIQAVVSGLNADVSFVAFVANGQRIYMTNSEPYRFIWDTTQFTPGLYRVAVEVYGKNGGLLKRSALRRVRVKATPPSKAPDETTPTVPGNGVPA